MIVFNLSRQQSVLLAPKLLVHQCLDISKAQSRRFHNIPPLVHHARYREKGIGKVLSPAGYDTAWTQYQGHLLHKLNQLTEGTAHANITTEKLILTCARQAEKATIFNYASMAHNNHHFFSSMSPHPLPMPESFATQINSSFSSLESFRLTFLASAEAMFGPGFVWLVKRRNPWGSTPDLAIINTYIAGSPYPGAHFRRQESDMNTITSNVGPNMGPESFVRMQNMNPVGAFGLYSKGHEALAPGGESLEVLLGVNTWQHVYLTDYGVGGKREYLEAWWESIDWEVVRNRAGAESKRRK